MTPRDIPAALWLTLILVVQPWAALMSARRRNRAGGQVTPDRVQRVATMGRPALYRASIFGLAQLLIVTVLLDWIDHWATVKRSLAFPRTGLWWILGCVAAHQVVALTTMVLRRVRGHPLEAGTARILPRGRSERVAFLPLAAMAGLSEEFLYRGFGPAHLIHWGLPPWLGWTIVLLSFGLAHSYKNLTGMLRTSLMGLIAAAPVIATGTLLPSMIAHAIADVLAGANTLALARRLGVAVEGETAPAVAAAASGA